MIKIESYLNYNKQYGDYSPVVVFSDEHGDYESIELGTYDTLEAANEVISKSKQGVDKFNTLAELRKYIHR